MNRESQAHFSNSPSLNISRSKFDRSFTHKTTFDAGELIPIFCDTTIMPGDTVKMKMSEVVRMTTPITPVMDNANLDLYFFFVPYRLIWNHFKRFMGENDTAPWIQEVEYEIPQISFPAGGYSGEAVTPPTSKGWHVGDLADYFGYPTEIGAEENTSAARNKYHASALPFRAYCSVWNEFFRDENLQNPVNVEADQDAAVRGISKNEQATPYDDVTMAVRGGKPLKVAKYHDYFTSCLPGAQKGPAVNIPLGDAPLSVVNQTSGRRYDNIQLESGNEYIWKIDQDGFLNEADTTKSTRDQLELLDADGYHIPGNAYKDQVAGYNIYADLSNATGATINQLRQAFAIQKFYERQALGGSRYIEMVKSHFDVTNPDFRLQRPEYLGGKRIPINMNQVVQSTPTNGQSTPLGSTGAFSVTSDADDMFTHSFTEHGILLGLACIRTVHTYQQGLNRQYSKCKLTDFYFPEFANLGNQAVLNQEIYMADGENQSKNEEAFGYQEAWACERYFPDIVTGMMRSNVQQSLDIWHWADYYNELPSLGDKWITEGKENIQRTLAVQDQPQFIADFYFGAVYTRPMPLYSIPGLIDHH